MADKHFTQIDAGAFQDWMIELQQIVKAVGFTLDSASGPDEHFKQLSVIRVMHTTLSRCVDTGEDDFMF